MAYDPYDRGDNPWRSDFGVPRMDMPRSNPGAKPGASRAASLTPAKKKAKPAVGSASPASPSRRPAVSPASPPRRPPPEELGVASGRGPESTAEIFTGGEGEHDYATGKSMQPGYTLDPERFSTPLRTTGPEMAVTPDERNRPIPMQMPPLPPTRPATPGADAALRGANPPVVAPPDVPPPNIPTGMLAGAPGAPGGPGYIPSAPPTGGPTPMMQPPPNWLMRLFGGGAG
jgi:hypothetical protein